MNSKALMIVGIVICCGDLHGVRYKIDGIKVTIFGNQAVNIITDSDIKRPGLDGSLRSLDDVILERLMFQDAVTHKMLPDEDAVDRYLKDIQRDNNMTHEQLKDVFKLAGYTYAEGREQFRMMTSVNSILDFKIRSRLSVPEREVRAYYDEHPVYEEASYKIERAFVPLSSNISIDELRQQLTSYAQDQGEFTEITWSPPFWVHDNELAEDKKFIASLEVDQVSMPIEISGGFELFKLKEKREHRLKPLDERYTEIANILRKPRYDKLYEEYKQNLFDATSIVYFN